MSEKIHVNLPGKVERIIEAKLPSEEEEAQISVEGDDLPFQNFRIKNSLTDKDGKNVRLKEGAGVEVIFESEKECKSEKESNKP